MSEMNRMPPTVVSVSNDQRHDAALTIIEHSSDETSLAAYYLTMVGLAKYDSDGILRAEGADEYELSWFTPRVSATGAMPGSPQTPAAQ